MQPGVVFAGTQAGWLHSTEGEAALSGPSPSITLVVIMPRLNVGQEIGDHLEISLCLLQVSGM